MLRLVTIAAVGAFATTQVFAQTADFTADMTWGPATVGQVLPIYFTVGDGTPVSLFFGNMSWNEPVASTSRSQLLLGSKPLANANLTRSFHSQHRSQLGRIRLDHHCPR
jgi:hypothetical protein